MQPNDITLKCYAEKEKDGTWFAICIDLNISATADNLGAVRTKLHSLIKEYVTEALTEDLEYAQPLLARKAPLYFQSRFYWLKFRHQCHATKNHIKSLNFKETLPISIA